MLFNFYIFEYFLNTLLLLTSYLIPWWSVSKYDFSPFKFIEIAFNDSAYTRSWYMLHVLFKIRTYILLLLNSLSHNINLIMWADSVFEPSIPILTSYLIFLTLKMSVDISNHNCLFGSSFSSVVFFFFSCIFEAL